MFFCRLFNDNCLLFSDNTKQNNMKDNSYSIIPTSQRHWNHDEGRE